VAAQPGPRAIPKTIDDATADPPPVASPHAGARPGMATVIGHAVAPVAAPTNLGQTLFDPSPRGSKPDDAPRAPDAPEPTASAEAAPQPAPAASPEPKDAPAKGREPALGKTMVLGGSVDAAAPTPAGASPTDGAAQSSDATKAPQRESPRSQSPLSQSVNVEGGARQAAMPALGDKQTILGMPAVGAPANAPVANPQALPSAMKTMLGVAMPGIAPTHERPPEPPGRMGTLLGVAVPGIAPTRPGEQGASPSAPMHPAPSARVDEAPPPIVPPPPPLVVEPLPEPPRPVAKKGVPAVAVVAIVFVIVLLIGGGAALLVLRSGAPLSAQPQLDETGKESLAIRCESCPDGTVIALGASSTKVEGGAAVLPLPAPLSIGDNRLEVQIDRPGAGRDETVKIHVPVAYRVKADLSTLTSTPPAITVRVEALEGTEITVDGQPVTLDASGRGSRSIDVAGEVEGTSSEQKVLERTIPFTVKPKGSTAPESGQLVVRATITPLHLDAPGVELFTDRSTAAVVGQTKPGGTLSIDGQSVAVDAQGRFAVRVELPAQGDKTLTLVASAPPLAPRTARAKVVRVASLDAAAKTLDAQGPIGVDTFGADTAANVGKLAVVEGEVLEIRIAQGYTVMLVEEKRACSAKGACVVRVVHGEEVRAARGASVRAYGRILGTVSSGGKNVPDVEGVLVIVRTGAKK